MKVDWDSPLPPLELAHLIESGLITEHGMQEVVLCLRQSHQQQAEIEYLKRRVEFWTDIADRERRRADRNE